MKLLHKKTVNVIDFYLLGRTFEIKSLLRFKIVNFNQGSGVISVVNRFTQRGS